MSEPKFFRYPYLAQATGMKKQKVHKYLTAHNYVIAPVTIDSKDFKFNSQFFAIPCQERKDQLASLKKRYLDYVWKQTLAAETLAKRTNMPNKQILLIHANLLNSLCLEELIAMYERNEYHFISLEEALKK